MPLVYGKGKILSNEQAPSDAPEAACPVPSGHVPRPPGGRFEKSAEISQVSRELLEIGPSGLNLTTANWTNPKTERCATRRYFAFRGVPVICASSAVTAARKLSGMTLA
jgi:hypothetical protein